MYYVRVNYVRSVRWQRVKFNLTCTALVLFVFAVQCNPINWDKRVYSTIYIIYDNVSNNRFFNIFICFSASELTIVSGGRSTDVRINIR